ncbi:MAG: hypothetical protein M1829_000921 [Trizodia sp. TS-e1964]|nr:MAG: hypothetical protein M1829_000921 [Trizodia sp. TS-e1964]
MPPIRTVPAVKPVKTERTHEENQERAYIAASRRSDRSLEARVESARRASEIHKKRTGRGLKVTEQDVINEEMYEEEDDDLPMRYRRLAAHLQTGSADFDRQLTAYLTTQVAMRSALDQAINSSFAQQYPNVPQFPHNHPSVFPSPFMLPPQAPQTQPTNPPMSYRQTPYPIPGSNGYRPNYQSTSMSVASAQKTAVDISKGGSSTQTTKQNRPSSASAPQRTATVSIEKPAALPTLGKTESTADAATDSTSDSFAPFLNMGNINFFNMDPAAQTQGNMQSPYDPLLTGPLSMVLPMESQMMLGGYLDPLDPLTSKFMPRGNLMLQPLYNSQISSPWSKQEPLHPSYDGINATLSPSALELQKPLQDDFISPTAQCQSITKFPYNFDTDYSDIPNSWSDNAAGNSGLNTPKDSAWTSFLNTDALSDGSV